jgi:hypothetical protein
MRRGSEPQIEIEDCQFLSGFLSIAIYLSGCIAEIIKPDRGITYTNLSISIPAQDALASLWSINISI